MLRALPFCLPLTLAACGGGGTYPALMPTEAILAEPVLSPALGTAPAAVRDDAAARAAALRARAQGLRGPVIESEFRAQMGLR